MNHELKLLGETFRRIIMVKSMQEEIEVGEQMGMLDVGPENGKVIIKAVRVYKGHQGDRLTALKKETEAKQRVLTLVKESGLKREQDGTIKLIFGKVTIKVTPQDDLITITEAHKKSKKGRKKKP